MLPLKRRVSIVASESMLAGVRRRSQKVLLAVLLIPCLIAVYLLIQPYLRREYIEPGPSKFLNKNRACNKCQRPRITEGHEYVRMEDSADERDGCALLKVTCGLERGTQAIIQWSFDGLDLGVSFNDREDQTNIERTLKCGNTSAWILKENGAAESVNELFCIVALLREDL